MSQSIEHLLPLEGIVALCREHGIRELSVFGSILEERFGPDSDIDLLVEFEESRVPSLFGLARIQRAFEALLGREVDLVPKDGLKPLVRSEVLAKARVLYAA